MKHQMAPFTVEYGNPCGCAAGLYTHGCDRYDDTSTNLTPMSYCRMQDTHRQEKSQDERSETPKAQTHRFHLKNGWTYQIISTLVATCISIHFNPFQSISIHFNQPTPFSQPVVTGAHERAARARPWVVVPAASRRPRWIGCPKKWMAFDKKTCFLTKHTRIDKNCMLCCTRLD